MKLEVQLFVTEHRTGCFTLRVVGDPSLAVFTDDLDDAREDLELVITDRVERTHPAAQNRFGAQPELASETIEVDRGLPVEGPQKTEAVPMKLTALVSRTRAWTNVSIPKLELHFWIDGKKDWRQELLPVLAAHLLSTPAAQKLEARFERREWIEKLAVDAEPPKLAAFTGKNRYVDMLPEPQPAEEQAEDQEHPKKPKKKPTPTLEAIATSLTRSAAQGELDRAQGRLRELGDLCAMLEKSTPAAIALIGPTGVGKSALLDELVHRLRSDAVSERLRAREVWFADAGRLIAGEGWAGEWQRQCLDVTKECEESNAVWYVGSLLALLDAGKTIHSDQNVSMLLKPLLMARQITVIGECTDTEWAQLELRDVGFARCFTPYRLEEPPPDEARAILSATAQNLEEQEGVRTTEDGLAAVMELCRRYASEGSRLGAAVQFLRRAVERALSLQMDVLDRRAIVSCFSAETGLPELVIRDDLPLDPKQVRERFALRVIGQEQAVDRMVDLIAVIKAGLSDLSKPLGSFLFVGPTGVGKTEMAKALAAYLFGSEQRLLRFDMSEYVGWDAIHRFLGDRDSEGKLVEAIRRSPFSVVLLDEVEKAHPAVFDVLLQVLGEGRLTDEAGRVAHFENAVVVMTSNLGVASFRRGLGFTAGDLGEAFTDHFRGEAEQFFRPELFNRIDHVVPFLPLDATQIGSITRRELEKFLSREGIRQRNLALEIGPEVHRWLAERGVDPRYGARPLKRTLERNLTIPLARRLSREDLEARRIVVHAHGEELELEVTGEREKQKRAARSTSAIDGADLLLLRDRFFRRTNDYRELAQSVRLVEQLSQTRQFWENRELAEARTRTFAAERELLEAFAAHRGRLESLSDLAYDAYFSNEAAAALELETAALGEAAAQLELRLFARRVSDPDRAVLYFDPAKDSRVFERGLIFAYAAVAAARGWKLELCQAHPEAVEQTVAKKRGERRSGVWRWETVVELEAGNVDRDDQDDIQRNRTLSAAFGDLLSRPEGAPLAVRFFGPFAGALLSTETGLHSENSSDGALRVHVLYQNEGALIHPEQLEPSGARRRTFNKQKWIVEDHLLGHQRALEKLPPVVVRFVSQVPALAMLGRRERGWFDALGI